MRRLLAVLTLVSVQAVPAVAQQARDTVFSVHKYLDYEQRAGRDLPLVVVEPRSMTPQ